MEKDKFPVLVGQSSRYAAAFASQSSSFPIDCDDVRNFSHDVNQMPENPPRNVGHRRAQSEILSLPEDITFDSELGVVGSGDGDGGGPSLSDETEEDLLSYLYMDMSSPSSPPSGLGFTPPPPSHTDNSVGNSSERPRVRHQHSQSMDDSTSIKPEMLASSLEGESLAETKKALSAAKLADIALVDPKRAKRIWANRQSAARSKERKMRYISELERKVQSLKAEATTLNAHLSLLRQDTTSLTSENKELKLRVQNMEQQNNLQDALNDALREEVQRLKVATAQAIPNGGQLMSRGSSSFGANHQMYQHHPSMQALLASQQLQQLQLHSQTQQQQFHPQLQQPPPQLKMKGPMTSQSSINDTSTME